MDTNSKKYNKTKDFIFSTIVIFTVAYFIIFTGRPFPKRLYISILFCFICELCSAYINPLIKRKFRSLREVKQRKRILEISGGNPINAIDTFIEEEMERQHIAGLSIGIVKNGELLIKKGYGFSNLNDSVPASENTIYKLASISKHIVAECIMELAEQEKLNLSDLVHKYFSDAPAEWASITILNLLNNTSGIRRESPAFKWMEKQPDAVLIKSVYNYKLLFPPGSKWGYSNMDYFILADIIRIVTGVNFEDYMNDFFLRHGLVHTTTTSKSSDNYKANGYRYNKLSKKLYEEMDFIALRPSGAFSSTITDMLAWDALHRKDGHFIKQRETMQKNKIRIGKTPEGLTACYGSGCLYFQYNGYNIMCCAGNLPGFTNLYWTCTDEKTSIIMLTNSTRIALNSIAKHIYDIIMPGGLYGSIH